VLPFESQRWWLVVLVDGILTIIFLIDFTYRLLTAPTKRNVERLHAEQAPELERLRAQLAALDPVRG
jgi:hypothetical protein